MPLNIDIQQIFLHLLNFVILFGVLYFLLYRPVCKFIDDRKNQYKEMEDRTNQNLTESEQKRAAYDEKLSTAKTEAEALRKQADKEASDAKEETLRQAKTEAEFIISNAHKLAVKEGERIREEAQKEVASMITEATRKVVQQVNTDASFDQFLDTADQMDENRKKTMESFDGFLAAAEQVKEDHTNE